MRKCVNELGRNTDILRLRHFPRAQHVTQVVGVYVGAHSFHAEDEEYRGREENVIDEVVDNIPEVSQQVRERNQRAITQSPARKDGISQRKSSKGHIKVSKLTG